MNSPCGGFFVVGESLALGSVSISLLDYNAESQRTQRIAEKSRIRSLLCVSPRPLRLCVKNYNRIETLPGSPEN